MQKQFYFSITSVKRFKTVSIINLTCFLLFALTLSANTSLIDKYLLENGFPNHKLINTFVITISATPDSICDGGSSQLSAIPSLGIPPYTYIWTSNPSGFNSHLQNPVVSPTISTTYILEVSDASGASETAFLNIEVKPNTPVSASSNSPVCPGEMLALYGNISSQAPDLASYCTPTQDNFYEWITDVIFDGNIHSSTQDQGGYGDFTSFTLASVNPGASYPIDIVIHPDMSPEWVTVFIDFNQDGNFETPEETFLGDAATGIITGIINVPPWAMPGETVMRVLLQYGDPPPIDPCSPGIYGESEDYKINIFGTTTPPIVAWNWMGPNGFSSMEQNPFIPNMTLGDAGIYVLSATNLFGCTNTDNVNVTVNPGTPISAGPDVTVSIGNGTTLSASGGINYLWSNGETGVSINVIPSVTSTYMVMATDMIGCTGTDHVIVNVGPLPTANAGPDQTICNGNCTSLSGSGGHWYKWSTGQTTKDITVCPPGSGSFMVPHLLQVTSSIGGTGTDMVNVFVNAPPIANAGQDVTICLNDYKILTGMGGTAFEWSTGETSQIISVSPSVTSTYTLAVTDVIGCTGTDQVIVSVEPCGTQVNAKALLQTSYEGNGQMSKGLQSIIPNFQSYNRAPWFYTGNENLSSSPVNSVTPSNMVDWILVELRDAEDSTLIVAQRAAILLDDGNIADTNLASTVNFNSVPPGNYYICLHHRNSIPVMSAAPIPIPNSTLYDFSDPVSFPPFGGFAAALLELEPGVYGMIGGDVNSDGTLKYSGPGNDRGLVLQLIFNQTGSTSITTTTNGYFDEDINMNSIVKYSGPNNDPSIIIQNIVNLTGSSSITTIFIGPVPPGVKSNP